MADFKIGDLVVLSSGSMRMAVEAVDDGAVSVVWCHEGVIGRDTFNAALLNKWEHREPSDRGDRADRPRAPRAQGDRDGGPKKYGDKPARAPRGRSDDRGGDDDRKPRGKTGWDGKPREKKYFRKDD